MGRAPNTPPSYAVQIRMLQGWGLAIRKDSRLDIDTKARILTLVNELTGIFAAVPLGPPAPRHPK
jgi:hypothetical protein